MTKTIDVNTVLEQYELLAALKERKQSEKELGNDETTIQALDNIIEQFEGTTSYQVLIEDN
jgi:hypothetical protein